MADDLNNQSQNLENLRIRAQEIVTDFARGLSNAFSELFEGAGSDASKFTEDLNKGLDKTVSFTDKIEKNQEKINKWSMSTRTIERQILDIDAKKEKIKKKLIDDEGLMGAALIATYKEKTEEHDKALAKLAGQLELVEDQEQKLGMIGRVLKGLNKIPFIGQLFDVNRALKKMRFALMRKQGLLKALKVGFASLGKTFMAALP